MDISKMSSSLQVDRGGGVPDNALLILDIKSTLKNQHIATKGYTFRELFEDCHQVSRWLNLENDVQVYLELNYRSKSQVNPKTRGPFSMLSFGSMKKKKESTPLIDGRSEDSAGDDVFRT
jgi:hypothetical protein